MLRIGDLFIKQSQVFGEARIWGKLPSTLRRALTRKNFDQDLVRRQKKYFDSLSNKLERVGYTGCWKISDAGDWHSDKCTVVLSKQAERLVVKARPVSSDVFFASVLEGASKKFGSKLYVPPLRIEGDVTVQEFFGENSSSKGTGTDLGHLLAFALWYGMIDLHVDNVLTNESKLALIDLDCAFSTNKGITTLERLHRTGISFQASILRKDSSFLKFKTNITITDILSSFFQMLNFLIEFTDTDFYKKADVFPVRKLFLHTRIYSQFIQKRYLYGWSESTTKNEWKKTRSKFPPTLSVLEAEISALLKWNIPYFFKEGKNLFELSLTTPVETYKTTPANGMKLLHRRLKKVGTEKQLGLFVKDYWSNLFDLHMR